MRPYTRGFYEGQRDGSRASAQVIVPMLLELVEVARVIDLGCGTGTWLSVFREHGVREVMGVDGPYVDRRLLAIPPECFVPFDLAQPFRAEARYDLALSLEVAEHLPAKSAGSLVESLVGLAPVVLFSAAVPGQGGHNHINEQWPEYWAELFEAHGCAVSDCIRPRVWRHPCVEPWYAQNLLLFCRVDQIERHPALALEVANTNAERLSLVHPGMFMRTCEQLSPENAPLGRLLRALPRAAARAVATRIRRLRPPR